jgi:chemotaxis response regulator CheB
MVWNWWYKKNTMEMDQESINLCKRLERSVESILHVLKGNELDDDNSMINQLREIKLSQNLLDKKIDNQKEIMDHKLQMLQDKVNANTEAIRDKLQERIAKLEKFKDKVIWIAVGASIGGGYGLKTLIDHLSK